MIDEIKAFFDGLGWLANVSELIGFIIFIWAFINVYFIITYKQENNKRITLVLEVEGQPSRSYTVPGTIRRKDYSQAEIMGRLGMIPRKNNSSSFTLGYVQKNPKPLLKIERIYEAKKDMTMTIPCSQEEFD